MKLLKKLASVAMASAMVMLCAPTVVNAAATYHVGVSSVEIDGVNASIAEAVAGMKPQFHATTGSIITEKPEHADYVEFSTGLHALSEKWKCLDTTVKGDNSEIYSGDNTSTFQFLGGKTYLYTASFRLRIKDPTHNTNYAFALDHDLGSSGKKTLSSEDLTVKADGKDLTLSDAKSESELPEKTLVYSGSIIDPEVNTGFYNSVAYIEIYLAYKVTVPVALVDVTSVAFSGVNTSLASAKPGSAPTFAAKIESVTADPAAGINSTWGKYFREVWIDADDSTNMTKSTNPNKSFKFELGKTYIYYASSTIYTAGKASYAFKEGNGLNLIDNYSIYGRALTSDEIKVTSDGSELPLGDFVIEDKIDSAAWDTLKAIAEVIVPSPYQAYDPDIFMEVGYYKRVTILPTASVTDVAVNGTVGTQIDSKEFTINTNNFTFVSGTDMAKWASVDGNSFANCINLPKGLEISYVSSDDTSATFKISGTPTEAVDDTFKITIPMELTNELNEDIEVTANANAKYFIAAAKAADNATDNATTTNTTTTGQEEIPDTGYDPMLGMWLAVFLMSIGTAGVAVMKLKGKLN